MPISRFLVRHAPVSILRVCALALFGAGLSACTGTGSGGVTFGDGSVVTYNQLGPSYARSFVVTGAQTGEFYVQIFGQPFPQPMSDLQIAQHITMPQWLGPTTATTQPGERVNRNFRALLVFNPDFRGPLTDSACRNPERIQTVAPRTGRIRVAAGFCIGDRMGSYLVADQEHIPGPQDPRFPALLSQVMLLLLPDRDFKTPSGRPDILTMN